MKKQILTLATIGFISASMFLSSCAKEDLNNPSITLSGDAIISIDLGATFTDPGYTATDEEDGDLSTSVVVTGTVDNTKVGTYTLTYNVSDEAGNAATSVERTVKVKSDKLAGQYAVVDVVSGANPSSNNGTYNYNATVTQSSSVYNKILIQNFGGFGSTITVTATIDGSTITIPAQSITPEGGTLATTISGTGSYVGADFKITNITYSSSAAFFGNGSATYTKQ